VEYVTTRQQQQQQQQQQQRILLSSPEERNNSNIIASMILTAHHSQDSQESLLLKWIRGVHLLNLSGIASQTRLLPFLSDDDDDDNDDSNTNNTNSIWLVRPFLSHTKHHLIEYLQSNEYSWRDDASNNSKKYLRNRIRNELIPLLQDLTHNTLDQRLENLVTQSQQVRADVQPRVQDYLQQQVVNDNNGRSYFHIHNDNHNDDTVSPLILSQALYQWMIAEMSSHNNNNNNNNKQSSSSPVLSYDTLQRVVQQLQTHPHQREWTLELGNHWNLQRQGSVLKVVSSTNNNNNNNNERLQWTWSLATNDNNNGSENNNNNNNNEQQLSSSSLIISIPEDWLGSDLKFVMTTVGDPSSSSSNLRFVPPWKPNTSSPIKVRPFLRGQRIPRHEREERPILVVWRRHNKNNSESSSSDDNDEEFGCCLVAVQVHNDEQWVVHAEYYHPQVSQTNKNDDDDDDASSTTSATNEKANHTHGRVTIRVTPP
jgi:hypothetical protein